MFIGNTEELAQNKLLLLYIIETSSNPFTKNELTEFVLEKNYMNYFLIQQYLSELLDSGFIGLIKEVPGETYHIEEKGNVALSYFKDRISKDIKSDLECEFKKKDEEALIQTQIVCDFYEKENFQYVVNIKLVEKEDTLFSLYLDVADKKQAEIICEKWKENTEYIYQNIISLLINEKPTLLE